MFLMITEELMEGKTIISIRVMYYFIKNMVINILLFNVVKWVDVVGGICTYQILSTYYLYLYKGEKIRIFFFNHSL